MQDYWVWCDMEMTGLSDDDKILEVAMVVTSANRHLEIIDCTDNFIIHQDSETLDNMNDWCKVHHKKSGLIEKVIRSNNNINDVEDELIKWLLPYINEKKLPPLCGNSIGTDRLFMNKWMPKLSKYFHYRNIDVTSIKLVAESTTSIKSMGKKQTHRALDDILESINELKYYIDKGMFPEDR